MKGIITKGIGGFYYVEANGTVYECRARGRFRKEKIVPLVGDKVMATIDHKTAKGVIEEILERDTELIRPPVANVNQVVIVFAIQQPEPNLGLLDRFLVMAESKGLDITICFNKIDLGGYDDVQALKKIYVQANYHVITTSTKCNMGIDVFKGILKDKVTVFAGPSGVGKSSLLNTTQPNLALKTGEISHKNERGKHTTRHVELLELDFGGWVVDTPGFSSLDIDCIEEQELQYLFREFVPWIGDCRFKGCKHVNEPECAIKDRVFENRISQSRYESYLQLLEQIHQKRRY